MVQLVDREIPAGTRNPAVSSQNAESVSVVPRFPEPVIVLLLIGAAFACYANTLGNGFVYDDDQQILQNPYIKSWHFLPQILTTTVWSFQGPAGNSNYFRPFMTLTLLLTWHILGPLPFGFHLVNLIFQAGVVVLVYFAGKRLWKDSRIAAVAALLFAVHPVHTEVVDWASSIADLEATFFALLVFLLYARLTAPSWKSQACIVSAFLLGLFSKEPALMIVPLLVAYEHGVRSDRQETSIAQKVSRYGPVSFSAALYLVIRFALLGSLAPVLERPHLTWPQTIYSGLSGVWSYAKFLLWPARLSVYHVFYPSDSMRAPGPIAGLLVILTWTILILWLRKKYPAVAFSILWIGVTLAPVLNVRWLTSSAVAERYTYLPSVGFCWLVGWLAIRFWGGLQGSPARLRMKRAVVALAGIGLFFLLAARTFARNPDWRDDFSLYTKTLRTDPGACYIRSNLGLVYYKRLQKDLALKEWQQALACKPDNVPALTNLGLLYTEQENYSEAAASLQRAIQLKPLSPDVHFDDAILLDATGHQEEALEEFHRAVELAPLDAVALRLYAKELASSGKTAEAESEFRQSIKLDPSEEALRGLSKIYLEERRNDLAEKTLRQLLSMNPYDATAHLDLAKLLQASGRTAEAMKEYQAVLFLDPRNFEAKSALQQPH
jgi:protein O-mannosyl-transferase